MSTKRGILVAVILSSLVIFVAGKSSVCSADYPHALDSGFTLLPNSARAMGMGGAFVAISDDYGASYFNPAGLVQLTEKEFGSLLTDLYGLGLLQYHFLSYAVPNTGMGAGAFSWAQLSADFEPEKWTYNLFSYSYARALSADEEIFFQQKKLSAWGVTLKYLTQETEWEDASGYSMDLGYLGRNGKFSWGLSLQDLFSQMNWGTGKTESLPLNIRIGGAYRFNSDLLAALDLNSSGKDLIKDIMVGGEWQISPTFKLRIGATTKFQQISSLALSTGIGFSFPLDKEAKKAAKFDYAFSYDESMNDTHRFSLSIIF